MCQFPWPLEPTIASATCCPITQKGPWIQCFLLANQMTPKVLDDIAIALKSARLVQLDDGRVNISARDLAFGACRQTQKRWRLCAACMSGTT